MSPMYQNIRKQNYCTNVVMMSEKKRIEKRWVPFLNLQKQESAHGVKFRVNFIVYPKRVLGAG